MTHLEYAEGLRFLRELEAHLVTLEIAAHSNTVPYASSTCARRILADALEAFGEGQTPDFPPIADDDTEAPLGDPSPCSTEQEPFGIWQPIATAPKDADLILVYSTAIGVQLATWLGSDDGSVSLAGWGPWGDADGRWSLRPDEQPSHWMPLPSPPRSVVPAQEMGEPAPPVAIDPVGGRGTEGPTRDKELS